MGKEYEIKGAKHSVAKGFTGVHSSGPKSYSNVGLQAQCEFVYQFDVKIKKTHHRDGYWTKEPYILSWEARGMLKGLHREVARECGEPIKVGSGVQAR